MTYVLKRVAWFAIFLLIGMIIFRVVSLFLSAVSGLIILALATVIAFFITQLVKRAIVGKPTI